MSELPQGIDPDVFEDLHTALDGLGLCHVLNRPGELWELVQLVKTDRAMVRGEIYRYDGLREAYRAAGIARTIVQRLDAIRERTGPIINGLRKFLEDVTGSGDAEVREFVIAFITISPKGRDAVARWIADPAGQKAEATMKIKAISTIVDGYIRALREWRIAPPPPSSPLDKENRPQLTPRFHKIDSPLRGPLIPSGAPVHEETHKPAAPHPAPAAAVAAPAATTAVAASPSARPAVATAPAALNPATAELAPPAPVSLILPRGVNPEVLEEVRRVDQCRNVFHETHQEIEVWEVFCLVMLDSEGTRGLMEQTLQHKEKGNAQGFTEGALALFERLLKLRAQYGKFVRDLRSFLGQLPVGTFGKETMEMSLGFIVASGRGRDRAQLWLTEPNRYRQEAAGRLEDVISRTMNYQTALRMIS